jgi:undecaprenyl-diphosphatase
VGSRRADRSRLCFAAALGSLLGFALTAALALRRGGVQTLDKRLLTSLAAHDLGRTRDLAELLSYLGRPVPQIALLAAVVAIGLRRGIPRRTLAAVLTVGCADLTARLLKKALVDHRLGAAGLLNPAGEHTFPSGHATTMTAVTFAFLLVVPARWRLPAAVLGATLTLLVGAAMVVLHKHWPSDVVGGVFVGAFWGFGAIAVLEAWPRATRPARCRRPATHRRTDPGPE